MQGFLGQIGIRREKGVERLAVRCGAAGVERIAVRFGVAGVERIASVARRNGWIKPFTALAVLHPFLLASSGDFVYLFCNVNIGVT